MKRPPDYAGASSWLRGTASLRFRTTRESSKHHMPLLAGGMTYLYLGIAILSEVVATTFLKLSDGFSKPLPSLVTVVGYAVAFYFLSLTLRSLPTGVVYAVWSGVGVVLIATIAWVFQSQRAGHGGALRHGPDCLRGCRDQSVFQRFVAVNRPAALNAPQREILQRSSSYQPYLAMPPCAKIASALDTSGFGQCLNARSQHFQIDRPCKRFAANEEVADNLGGLPPIRFQERKRSTGRGRPRTRTWGARRSPIAGPNRWTGSSSDGGRKSG